MSETVVVSTLEQTWTVYRSPNDDLVSSHNANLARNRP